MRRMLFLFSSRWISINDYESIRRVYNTTTCSQLTIDSLLQIDIASEHCLWRSTIRSRWDFLFEWDSVLFEILTSIGRHDNNNIGQVRIKIPGIVLVIRIYEHMLTISLSLLRISSNWNNVIEAYAKTIRNCKLNSLKKKEKKSSDNVILCLGLRERSKVRRKSVSTIREEFLRIIRL